MGYAACFVLGFLSGIVVVLALADYLLSQLTKGGE